MTGFDCSTKEFRQRLEFFQKRAGYQFSDPALLALAFTHGSLQNEQSPQLNNDRLEFLGDAALGLLVGEELYKEYPEADEGFMTIERSKLVCGKNLAAWGYEAGFDGMLCVGDEVDISDAMVEDSVEAVAGAFYLDGGLEAVKAFLQSFSDYPDRGNGFDARSHLARVCEIEKRGTPRYDTQRTSEGGCVAFHSAVKLDGQTAGEASGSDQPAAERAAARSAMIRLCHMSMSNQGKKPALLVARYRKVAIGQGRKAKTALRKDSCQSDSDLLFKIIAQEGPDHKPVFTAGAFKGSEKVAEGQGLTKKGACKAAERAAAKLENPEALENSKVQESPAKREGSAMLNVPVKRDVFSAFQGLNVQKLQNDPEVKNKLQSLCERAGIGCPRYDETSLADGSKMPPFRIALCAGATLTADGIGPSKKAAGNSAAWQIFRLAALDAAKAPQPCEGSADSLAERVESQFKTLLAARGMKDLRIESASVMDGGAPIVKTQILNGALPLAVAQSANEEQARFCAIIRAVTRMHLWDKMLWLLGCGALIPSETANWRPDLCLYSALKARNLPLPGMASIQAGGNGSLPDFRVGIFIGGDLATYAVAPNKKLLEQQLSLTILDRLARGQALVPEGLRLKSSPSKAAKTPSCPQPAKAPAPAAPSAPLPQKEKGPGLLHKFRDWFHHMGDLYTK